MPLIRRGISIGGVKTALKEKRQAEKFVTGETPIPAFSTPEETQNFLDIQREKAAIPPNVVITPVIPRGISRSDIKLTATGLRPVRLTTPVKPIPTRVIASMAAQRAGILGIKGITPQLELLGVTALALLLFRRQIFPKTKRRK